MDRVATVALLRFKEWLMPLFLKRNYMEIQICIGFAFFFFADIFRLGLFPTFCRY